jgi:hypothetical protein
MTTYVVFDKETGRIVHTHRDVAVLGEPGPRARKDVLEWSRRIAVDAIPKDLDIVELEQEALRQVGPGREVYVDVEKRVLMDRATSE